MHHALRYGLKRAAPLAAALTMLIGLTGHAQAGRDGWEDHGWYPRRHKDHDWHHGKHHDLHGGTSVLTAVRTGTRGMAGITADTMDRTKDAITIGTMVRITTGTATSRENLRRCPKSFRNALIELKKSGRRNSNPRHLLASRTTYEGWQLSWAVLIDHPYERS
jgi:hypothetical protein